MRKKPTLTINISTRYEDSEHLKELYSSLEKLAKKKGKNEKHYQFPIKEVDISLKLNIKPTYVILNGIKLFNPTEEEIIKQITTYLYGGRKLENYENYPRVLDPSNYSFEIRFNNLNSEIINSKFKGLLKTIVNSANIK